MRSEKNPADRPSRVRVPRPLEASRPVCVVVHLFSGRRRHGDIHFWLQELGAALGLDVIVLSVDPVDPVISKGGDLLDDALYSYIRGLCWRGWSDGVCAGAPCRTWSAVRFMPGGPRPVRDFSHPFGLPRLTEKESVKVRIDSELFLRALDCMDGTAATGGACLKEHPADRKVRPYPSIFRTPQWKSFSRRHGATVREIDQCMLGALSRKRTSLGAVRLPFDYTHLRCVHRGKHAQTLGGFDRARGCFATHGSERYPSDMCRRIAEAFLRSYHPSRLARSEEALAPLWIGAAGLDARGYARRGAAVCSEVWPAASTRAVPPRVARGLDPRAVLGSSKELLGLVSGPCAAMGNYGN